MLTPAPARIVRAPASTPGLVTCGFDPGIASPACTVVRAKAGGGYERLHHEVIRTSTADPDLMRYRRIFDAVGAVLRQHAPACMVIEEQLTVQVAKQGQGEFNGNNGKTLISFGAALGAAFAYGVTPHVVRPQTIKIAVLGPGNKAADKKQVQRAVEVVLGVKLPQDAADAGAMAIYGQRLSARERMGR